MDEPDGGCSWQAWKFGMKREDLYTKLQDQYNTVTLSIQDPDAFHHDVCEISKTAVDLDEFYRMLEERKELRLNQLNESLQSASVEIIANPNLIGTDQWQHAIQLFRTRSFDSLVRYFSSYLPDDHLWNTMAQDPTTKPFFNEVDDPTPIITHEPLYFMDNASSSLIPESHLPPSPRSLTMCSDSSSASTPARTLSFSEPESDDNMLLSATLTGEYDDETSQWDDPDTPTTPISEISDIMPSKYIMTDKHGECVDHDAHEQSDASASLPSSSSEDGAQESETPTPREVVRDRYLTEETSKEQLSSMSSSSKYTPLERRFREGSPGLIRARRRSPEIGRIQKPSHDLVRARPKGLKS